jgi:hypothetical protein
MYCPPCTLQAHHLHPRIPAPSPLLLELEICLPACPVCGLASGPIITYPHAFRSSQWRRMERQGGNEPSHTTGCLEFVALIPRASGRGLGRSQPLQLDGASASKLGDRRLGRRERHARSRRAGIWTTLQRARTHRPRCSVSFAPLDQPSRRRPRGAEGGGEGMRAERAEGFRLGTARVRAGGLRDARGLRMCGGCGGD